MSDDSLIKKAFREGFDAHRDTCFDFNAAWRDSKSRQHEAEQPQDVVERVAKAIDETAICEVIPEKWANPELMNPEECAKAAIAAIDGEGFQPLMRYADRLAKATAEALSQYEDLVGYKSCWFAERHFSPRWLQGFSYNTPIWTDDPLKAIRFQRKCDAEALCGQFGLFSGIGEGAHTPNPTQHVFVDGSNVARCPICDWPIAETAAEGCVPGNCSYRPFHGTPEWHRIERRKAELSKAKGKPA